MRYRFDGYLPVVVDLETGGFHSEKDALLEVAAFLIDFNQGQFSRGELFHRHIMPFEGAHLDPNALAVNRIDPYHPFRFAIPEKQMLEELFIFVNKALQLHQCRRAVLVGHNAHFDLGFLQKAYLRSQIKEKNPFHSFTTFDTATLAGLVYGKTVLAKGLRASGIYFDVNQAHSAIYDAQATADLFCKILNQFPLRKRNHQRPPQNNSENLSQKN